MTIYEFTLSFCIANCFGDVEEMIEALGEGGCTDALIGMGRSGYLGMMFAREASSAIQAVTSAITDVQRILPNAQLSEAVPDLVGLTDVAELLGCSRQNMRKLMLANANVFPAPVYQGKQSLWHLESLLLWLKEQKHYDIEASMIELARANRNLNLVNAAKDSDPQQVETFRALLAAR